MCWRAFWLAIALALFAHTPASADDLRPGYMEWNQQPSGDWQLAWKLPLAQRPTGDIPMPVLPPECRYSQEPQTGASGAAIVGSAAVSCTAPLAGKAIGMEGLLGQSDMLVRIAPLDAPVETLRLTAAAPSASLPQVAETGQVWKTYFILGVEHILAGWDHLLFVIALVLLVQDWRRVVAAATAFTLAHSITLAGASLGFIGLPARPVEAIIALSIVFLAYEVIRAQQGEQGWTLRVPWVVAFLFGLVHGFGFAGALNEIGLPDGEVVAALLAFNLGVEAGQLLVVACVLGLIWAIRRAALSALQPAVRIAAYGIGITGSYWLFERVIG